MDYPGEKKIYTESDYWKAKTLNLFHIKTSNNGTGESFNCEYKYKVVNNKLEEVK